MSVTYITSINSKSTSGDKEHIDNVVKAGGFFHKNLRFTKLYFFLIKNHRKVYVIRESVDLLLIAILPQVFLKYLIKNTYIEINGSIVDEKLNRKIIWVQRRLIKSCKGIIFVSKGLKLRFEDLYGKGNYYVVNNGGKKYHDIKNKLETSCVKIAFVGANTSWQKVNEGVNRLASIKTDTEIHVKIAGPGFENSKSLQRKNITVEFIPKVSRDRAEEIYRWCNILMLPDVRIYKDEMLSSSIKAYECLNMNRLVWHIRDWDLAEFDSYKNKFIKTKDIANKKIIIDKIKRNQTVRTWDDVAFEIKKITGFNS